MISYEAALEKILKAEQMPTIQLGSKEACGYVSSQNSYANETVPPFANSAMDGYAVRAGDIRDASPSNPISLPLKGKTAAGDKPSKGIGGVWEIMTGAYMPEGYDAVVKVEDVEIKNDTIEFTSPTIVQNNIRKAGEDFLGGDLIASPGTRLGAYHVMALAATGVGEVLVYKKPTLSVFSTGNELEEDLNAELQAGHIRNSNSPYLLSAIEDLGYSPQYGGVHADDADLFEGRLKESLTHSDIVISTGAVSAGKYDFIPALLEKMGAEIVFHKVAIRPAKPVLYARLETGQHFFGLPGNPISAAVGLRFFVLPLLRHIEGQAFEAPLKVQLSEDVSKKPGLKFFLKAHVSSNEKGCLQIEVLPGQQSFKIKPMLRANCWAVLPAEKDKMQAGDLVSIYPLMPDAWGF